ncbi:MAG: DUF262 domain-containing protein, partial [Limnohabitans sp.]|nr:DUF262 domain-containing protein [Limnohabitans sp.]
MKLKESIPSNSVKIIDLYNKIDAGILDTSPDFQRKLVWKKQHKYSFIETILMNFPFPEVYIASAEMDVETLKSKEIVVDGKQRLTTILDYIKGIKDFENQKRVTPFEELTTDEKRDFLNYLVTVKDLKDMDESYIKEIFQRINSTEYSLNSNERINAQYGGGEFALFCKQIVDSNYTATINETDIIIENDTKILLNSFFNDNEVFTENDKARMFDEQYVMLIVSTFLEGGYYGRSSKVNEYLDRYNASFENYTMPLGLLVKSVNTIKKLGFYRNSYWFNKANLFTLIIELSRFEIPDINLQILEQELLELETKVDLYFSDDDTIDISDNEKKYFEVARQGSHEKANRIFRGKLINDIITKSLNSQNVELHTLNNQDYTIIIPTNTGLNKAIMDATTKVREFLKINEIHDYDSQQFGSESKKIIKGVFIYPDKEK